MRTQGRDQSGTITFSSYIADAASGAGVAQPGSIPYTFTRDAAGVYRIRFDARLAQVSLIGPGVAGGGPYLGQIFTQGPGIIQVNLQNNAFAQTGGSFYWSVTAVDKRT